MNITIEIERNNISEKELLESSNKEFVKNRIKDARRKLSSAKSRYEKLRKEGKNGWQLATAFKNIMYWENDLDKLLTQARGL
jgi:DNA polymerase IIIc chi subunit